MVKRKGTENAEALFGTDKNDVLRGLGGRDNIIAGDGNDRISGLGTIDAGNGRDSWFSVKTFDLHRAPFADVKLGNGNDLVVHNNHGADFPFDGAEPRIDMGPGNDRLVIGGTSSKVLPRLGEGSDTAYIMTEWQTAVYMGGERLGDGDRDVVHFDSKGASLTLWEFGEEDVLVLYGTGLTRSELDLRSTFTLSNESFVEITLDLGTSIFVNKGWLGELTADNVRLVDGDLRVAEKVMIGDGPKLEDALFLSTADNNLAAKGRAVFAGSGDDVVRGNGTDDRAYGENGDDRLLGKGGDDTLFGGYGNDTIFGGNGKDELHTGAGFDVVRGGKGNDLIVHGEQLEGMTFQDWNPDAASYTGGETSLRGDGGSDSFVFAAEGGVVRAAGGKGRDDYTFDASSFGDVVIEDFSLRQDKIVIETEFDSSGRLARAIEFAVDTSERSGTYAAEGLVYDFGGLAVILEGLTTADRDRIDIELVFI